MPSIPRRRNGHQRFACVQLWPCSMDSAHDGQWRGEHHLWAQGAIARQIKDAHSFWIQSKVKDSEDHGKLWVIDVEKEKKRLDKELKNLQDDIHKLKDKISNVNFIKKAPAGIVEKEKNRLAAQEVKLRKIISQIRLIETPQDL